MIKADHFSQICLYAKGWFARGDKIEDLKILMGEAFALYPKDISMRDISTTMVDVVQTMGLFDNPRLLREFISEISPEYYYRWTDTDSSYYMHRPHPDYDYDRAIIGKTLSMLSCMKVKDCKSGERIVLFKKPNFELLPMKPDLGFSIEEMEWDDDC